MPEPCNSPPSHRLPSFAYPWPTLGQPPGLPPSLGRSRPTSPLPPEALPIAHSPQYLLYLAEIGENTAGLVHDMRGPLSVILNGLRLCHRMPLPQIARQRLALALEEAERLNRMVNEVITFARSAYPSEVPWQTPDSKLPTAQYSTGSPPAAPGQDYFQ